MNIRQSALMSKIRKVITDARQDPFVPSASPALNATGVSSENPMIDALLSGKLGLPKSPPPAPPPPASSCEWTVREATNELEGWLEVVCSQNERVWSKDVKAVEALVSLHNASQLEDKKEVERLAREHKEMKAALEKLIQAVNTNLLCGRPEIKTVDDVIWGMREVARKMENVANPSNAEKVESLSAQLTKAREALHEIFNKGVRGSDTCWGKCDSPGIAKSALSSLPSPQKTPVQNIKE